MFMTAKCKTFPLNLKWCTEHVTQLQLFLVRAEGVGSLNVPLRRTHILLQL